MIERPTSSQTTLPADRPDRLALAPIAALALIALALRPQVTAVGPLADAIGADLDVSHAFVGLLTTIPVLCMGLFALFGPSLAHVISVRGGIALSATLVVMFGILRLLVPGSLLLLVLTFGVGAGMGIVGPMLAMFVRGRLPQHVVAGTAAYASGTLGGVIIASAAAVPLMTLTGSWRGSLLVLSIGSGFVIAAWLALARPAPGPRSGGNKVRARLELPKLPVRRPVAWAIAVVFGLQSWLFYGTTAWLASVYIERGWDAASAGWLLTSISVASLIAIGGVPFLSSRGATRRVLLASSAGIAAVGLVGVAAIPEPAFLWTILIGVGTGASFTLALVLPIDISDDPRQVGDASALMLLVGYLLASVAPFALGAVRDLTGNFETGLWLLVLIAGAMVVLAWNLTPARLLPHARIAVG